MDRLLVPRGYEQFNIVELVLPLLIDVLTAENTSILASWFLFDKAAIALGQNLTKKFLLDPILKLYSECDDRVKNNSSFDSLMRSSNGLSFKSRKAIKLYHHSFLLRLIVRFGLNCFLNNFVPPLIEAIGGCREADHQNLYHHHQHDSSQQNARRTSKMYVCATKRTRKIHKISSTLKDGEIEQMMLKKPSESDEMFTFENESDDLQKSINVHLTDTSSDNDIDRFETNLIDGNFSLYFKNYMHNHISLFFKYLIFQGLQLNHSNAIEVTEETTLSDNGLRLSDLSGFSFEYDNNAGDQSIGMKKEMGNLVLSPTIPIPSSSSPSSKRNQLNTIDCEIGSKISTEDTEMFIESSMAHKENRQRSATTSLSSSVNQSNSSDQQTQYQISDMSAESLIWLAHRLGPVLTARYLTRNLLKMLTLCYIGQENLIPDLMDNNECKHDDLLMFTIADARVSGDRKAVKVLECLTSITAIYGDQFILLQYFPHITELIALCKKRITSSLEGGLISSLQLLKYVVRFLSDTVIMEQLHVSTFSVGMLANIDEMNNLRNKNDFSVYGFKDTILKNIIHPIIRFIASTRFQMPNGFLARSVLARKLLDALYVLSVRVGPEMSKTYLCIPALQR